MDRSGRSVPCLAGRARRPFGAAGLLDSRTFLKRAWHADRRNRGARSSRGSRELHALSSPAAEVSLIGLPGIPEVRSGADLSQLLVAALGAAGIAPQASDVLVVAQKVVSKAEGRLVPLASVTPGARAQELAQVTGKDARLIELVLTESTEVLRARKDVLIVRHRLGFVMANAGIDRSNLAGGAAGGEVLLLPQDPDASAARLRADLAVRLGSAPAVIVSDSFGRPWRRGVVNIALGAAGLPALLDRRGESDRAGRRLEVTEVALGDALAAAAGLVMGEAAEGVPAVLVRGYRCSGAEKPARSLIRPITEDLFR
ncbi:MAG: coenzyme F420-0:L-glutamate ligase [Proteobacteria bacterium]|nr:coenzyme F420-0:L-glutamate ligase [Pseudomonadota bacterium]